MPAVVFESTIPMVGSGLLGRLTNTPGLSSRLAPSAVRTHLDVLSSSEVASAIAAYAAPLSHTHSVGDIVGVTASRLIGRGAGSGNGVAQEITLGSGLSLSGTTLSATGGAATTINNNANNRVITGSDTADTLEAESNFTYDATTGQCAIQAVGTTNPFIVRNSSNTQVFSVDPDGQVGVGEVTNYNGFNLVFNIGNVNGDGFLIQAGSDASNQSLYRAKLRQLSSAGQLLLYNSSGQVTHQIGVPQETVFNEQGAAVNLRIEGDTKDHLFFCNGALDTVNFGHSSTVYRSFSVSSTGGMTMSGTIGAVTNTVAGNLIIAPTPSTGSATPSNVVIQGTMSGVSGSSPQALEDILTIGARTVRFANAVNVELNTSTGTKWGTSTTQKQAWWNATPVAQPVLATGAGATVDDVITTLQTLGLCRQS